MGLVSSLTATNAFFQVQNQAKGAISVQIIPMKSLASQETQAFVELHGRHIGDFGLKRNLGKQLRWRP